MNSADHELTIDTQHSAIRVRVTANALHLMWEAGSGPQTPEGLIAANLNMIEELIAMAPPGADGVIVISEDTIEG